MFRFGVKMPGPKSTYWELVLWIVGVDIIFCATQLSFSPFAKLHIGSFPQYEKFPKQTNFHFSFYSRRWRDISELLVNVSFGLSLCFLWHTRSIMPCLKIEGPATSGQIQGPHISIAQKLILETSQNLKFGLALSNNIIYCHPRRNSIAVLQINFKLFRIFKADDQLQSNCRGAVQFCKPQFIAKSCRPMIPTDDNCFVSRFLCRFW